MTALPLSWTLEIVKCTKGEDQTVGVVAASITPRKEVDATLVSVVPRKEPRQVILMPPLTVKPDWAVTSAASKYQLDLAVNEAEYYDLDGRRTTVKITAVTRSCKKYRHQMLQEEIVKRMMMERFGRAQDEEKWIVDLKAYLRGDVQDLTSTEAKTCLRSQTAKRRMDRSNKDRDLVTKLVVPETLQDDLMHHYHSSLEGDHQGIGQTYPKIRAHFHWRRLYRSVERYVGQCQDCDTGKGRPTIHG
ncbi:Reverse transcriptase [Phytophthora palmivora]|uniref:Reverse transcriptase n=1 Tax=Phytophthora palmivora TaxID=4796 RepID=A0A2P4XVX3_9STRA|nr:Reverse transcriptase [Phytophthora palmivora]